MTNPLAGEKGSLDLLTARALVLAQPLETSLEDRPGLLVLEYELAGEFYGVELSWVRETKRLQEWTPVPGTPDFILGVLSLRGEILSLVDLTALLGLSSYSHQKKGYAIRVGSDEMEFCIWADAVVGPRRVAMEEIQPPPASGASGDLQLIFGVTGDCLNLVDGDRLLSHPELVRDAGEGSGGGR